MNGDFFRFVNWVLGCPSHRGFTVEDNHLAGSPRRGGVARSPQAVILMPHANLHHFSQHLLTLSGLTGTVLSFEKLMNQ